MGAASFTQIGRGPNVQKAFAAAIADALYEHGHGGYSGSCAEKVSYVTIPMPADTILTPEEYADHLMAEDDPRISDKWGPAGAIKLGDDEWLFFGWASS